MWQSVKVSNVFNTLTLKQIFWKTKTIFQKLEYSFLVESTKIENTSFPYKTAISEANVKANRMVTAKWTYHIKRSLASNYFFFWKSCFSLRTSYIELISCTNNPNDHICTFCKRWCFFPESTLNVCKKYKIKNEVFPMNCRTDFQALSDFRNARDKMHA